MQKSTITLCTSLLLMATIGTAQAGLFDKLKDKAKEKSKQEAEKVLQEKAREATSNKKTSTVASSASGGNLSLEGGPAANLRSFTTCNSLKPTNIMVGNVGTYYFQQGMSKQDRTGFINRKAGKLSHGCILPSLEPQQMIYMEVDEKQYSALGNSNSWEMQCVRSADPSKGAIGDTQGKTEYPYKVSYLSGKDMMLHCGNDQGVSECETGSNSKRSGAWKKKLKAKGKAMLSVYATTSTLAPKQGEKLYCQYYNKKTSTSLFAFEYIRANG